MPGSVGSGTHCIIINVHRSSPKIFAYLSVFMNLEFLNRFLINPQISGFMNILLWDPIFSMPKNRQTDRTKLIFSLSNFTKTLVTNKEYFPEQYYNLIFIKEA